MEAAREHAIRQAYKDTIDYSIKMKRSDNLLLEDEVGLTKSEHKHGKRKYQCAEQVSSDEIDDEFDALHDEQSKEYALMENRRGQKIARVEERPKLRKFSGEERQEGHGKDASGGHLRALEGEVPSPAVSRFPPQHALPKRASGPARGRAACATGSPEVLHEPAATEGLLWLQKRGDVVSDLTAMSNKFDGASGMCESIKKLKSDMETEKADVDSLQQSPDDVLKLADKLRDDIRKAIGTASSSKKDTFQVEVERCADLKQQLVAFRPVFNELSQTCQYLLAKKRSQKRSDYMTAHGQNQRLQKEFLSGGFNKNFAKYMAKHVNQIEMALSTEDTQFDVRPFGVFMNSDLTPDIFNMSAFAIWEGSHQFAQDIAKHLDVEAVTSKAASVRKHRDDNPAWQGALGMAEGVFMKDVLAKMIGDNIDDPEGSEVWVFANRRGCLREPPQAIPLPGNSKAWTGTGDRGGAGMALKVDAEASRGLHGARSRADGAPAPPSAPQLAEKELQVGSLTQRAAVLEARLQSQDEDYKLLETLQRTSGAEEHAAALCALRVRLGTLHGQLQEERLSASALRAALHSSERALQERPRPPEQAGFRQLDLGAIIAKDREVCQLQQMLTEELSRRGELEARLELYDLQCRQGAWVTPRQSPSEAAAPGACQGAGGHQSPARPRTPLRSGARGAPLAPLRPLTPARVAIPILGPLGPLVSPSLSMPVGDAPATNRSLASPRSMPLLPPPSQQPVLYATPGGGNGRGPGSSGRVPAAGAPTPPAPGASSRLPAARLRWPAALRRPASEEKAVDAVNATSIASPSARTTKSQTTPWPFRTA
ncbi:unnamed protein product [Prorocentrum cordatum]|uniref:Uncharacterized protein n=1 Tax=Prorocentrum cordatum TaxID=2364126 RepID=A0ABN9PMJ1_9DINO|nr:unnamed protein product [Polarella glacialis]